MRGNFKRSVDTRRQWRGGDLCLWVGRTPRQKSDSRRALVFRRGAPRPALPRFPRPDEARVEASYVGTATATTQVREVLRPGVPDVSVLRVASRNAHLHGAMPRRLSVEEVGQLEREWHELWRGAGRVLAGLPCPRRCGIVVQSLRWSPRDLARLSRGLLAVSFAFACFASVPQCDVELGGELQEGGGGECLVAQETLGSA